MKTSYLVGLSALFALGTAVAGDAEFLAKASEAALVEIAGGKLAVVNGQNMNVRKFGVDMLRTHVQAHERWVRIAKHSGEKATRKPNATDAQELKQLSELKGDNFDVVYLQTQIDNQKRWIELLEGELQHGTDEAAKGYANALLPEVRNHLEMADQLAKDVSGNARRVETAMAAQ